jgi:hypothetical protein
MEKGKHTPGPWYACHKQVWSDHYPVAEVAHGPWGDPYAALEITGGELDMQAKPVIKMIEYGIIPIETAEANARLIAAAPELLEALEKIAKMEIPHGSCVDNQMRDIARAAIAKAKGEGA